MDSETNQTQVSQMSRKLDHAILSCKTDLRKILWKVFFSLIESHVYYKKENFYIGNSWFAFKNTKNGQEIWKKNRKNMQMHYCVMSIIEQTIEIKTNETHL